MARKLGLQQAPPEARGDAALGTYEFASPGFSFGKDQLIAQIVVEGSAVGVLEVHYRGAHPPAGEGPFRLEERALLDALAQRVAETLVLEAHG